MDIAIESDLELLQAFRPYGSPNQYSLIQVFHLCPVTYLTARDELQVLHNGKTYRRRSSTIYMDLTSELATVDTQIGVRH